MKYVALWQYAIALCNGVRGLKCNKLLIFLGAHLIIALCNGVRGLKFFRVIVNLHALAHRTL